MAEKQNLKPLKTDPKAPELLEIIINNKDTGENMFKEIVKGKNFSTGSVGYYVGVKMANPESGERYQIVCNIILIGSNPNPKKTKKE